MASARHHGGDSLLWIRARQDRRPRTARVAITAKLVADMIQIAGAHRVLTMDLHADQIRDSSTSVDNIYASLVLLGDIWRSGTGPAGVSPDVGGVVRARAHGSQKLWEVFVLLGGRYDQSPIPKALSTFLKCKVQSLLMGGQACILYGAAEFSRDIDLAVMVSYHNLENLKSIISVSRPLLISAIEGNQAEVQRLLRDEEDREKELDRQYWTPLRLELEAWRHGKD